MCSAASPAAAAHHLLTHKHSDMSGSIRWRAEDLLLVAHVHCCRHIQATHAHTHTHACKRVFPPIFFFFFLKPTLRACLASEEEHRSYLLYSRRRLRVAAAVSASLRRREEASSWADGDQLSCRRLDRSVFMAAAGRDVSVAPSIQRPSDGFSPCFIIIPIISRGGGSRLLAPLLLLLLSSSSSSSCPSRPSRSPFLASDAI